MDEVVLLTSLTLFTLLAGLCSIIFNRIKLPPLIGYLMAGIIIANFWHTSEEGELVVGILSDMGLIMLMFCIGMEINLKKIRKQGVFAIEVAIVQLPLMVICGVIAGSMLGFNSLQSICLGAIISGSSTAVVMAVLKSQNRLDKEQIDMLVLITIMEDIGQVIMLSMLTPMLAGSELDTGALIAMIVSILVFMLASIFIGLKVVPRIINWVSDNVTSEVLVVFSVGLAFGMALLASYVGLSVAIGAFLMGMMIASSRKHAEITHDIEPMKNIFMAMFFISVGMEISLGTLWENIGLIVIFFVLFAVCKTATVFLGYWIGNTDCRTGFMSAVSLAAMGEFAFIIAKEALDYNVVDSAFYTSVIGAALVSMIALPFLTKWSMTGWDRASERCPERLMDRFKGINTARSEFYERLSSASKKSRKELSTRLTHSYVHVGLIFAIEIVFYYAGPVLKGWLMEQFLQFDLLWSILILLINFIVLFVPLRYLVKNIKFVERLSRANAEYIVDDESMVQKAGTILLSVNSAIIAAVIDAAILIVVPNDLGNWEHTLVFIAAIAILAVYEYRKYRKEEDAKSAAAPVAEEDDFAEIDMEQFRALMMQRFQEKAAKEERPEGDGPEPPSV